MRNMSMIMIMKHNAEVDFICISPTISNWHNKHTSKCFFTITITFNRITITINIAHRQRHPSFKTSLLFILGLFILLFTGTFFRYFLLFLLQYLFFVLFNYRMNERRWRLIKNFMCKSRFFCVIENQFSQLKIEIKLLSKFLCKIVIKPTDAPKGEGGGRGTGTGRRPIFCQIH